MTKLFFCLAIKIMRDNVINGVQICSFGDVFQNIYTYAGSDGRYLTFANKLFPFYDGGRMWDSLRISTSYRITRQMANFINVNLLKSERLKAVKDGPNVKYVIADTFNTTYAYHEILKCIKLGYKPDDIFVLGVTLKKGSKASPIGRLENKLVMYGIPCHSSVSDDSAIDEEIIKGKVCFASFCQVKGMERKVCIVYGFDESYFTFFAKDADRNVCPNVFYVALTRAQERLILIHNYSNDYITFLNPDFQINKTCDVIVERKFMGGDKPSDEPIASPSGFLCAMITTSLGNDKISFNCWISSDILGAKV